MFYPREVVDDVKRSVDFVSYVSQYTDLKKTGSSWTGCCPHPAHKDEHPSFTVYKTNTGDWAWHCFSCPKTLDKFGHDCIGFVRWLHGISFNNAVERLAKFSNIPIHGRSSVVLSYDLEIKIHAAQANLLPQIRNYLYQRGLNDKDIDRWEIGFKPYRDQGTYTYRISFPLRDRVRRCVGFCGRYVETGVSGKFAKYLHSSLRSGFDKKSYFFGEQFLNAERYCIITEGVFDVILAEKFGLQNVLATLGTAFTIEHAQLLKDWKKIPTFIFDGDTAGQKATERAIDICKRIGLDCKVCLLPQDIDLADLALRETDNLLTWISSHTVPAWSYLLQDITKDFESKIRRLQEEIMSSVIHAYSVNQSEENKILARSYIKNTFGIWV